MHLHKPKSLLDALVMEKNMYEVALTEWNTMEPSGTAFSPQMQKDVSWALDIFRVCSLLFCPLSGPNVVNYYGAKCHYV